MTLGSLFDGIGGFPLAGLLCGITPVWASEIEQFPMSVTAERFPEMKQLGSVTDIDGAYTEPVDIITFGSPCQDLSVAGKQLGIRDGKRSSLFFEAVRIIKEMRKTDEHRGRTGVDTRHRFAVWENVPGAFSSNNGEDFKAVLEALAGVREDGISIPRPQKWNHAGCMAGHGWSIAWRVYDAQYWGVPQRRKRIYLVADFASERAGEILFERESVRGNPETGGETRERTADDAERSAGGSGGVGIGAFMGGQGAKARSIGYCDDGTTTTIRAAESGSNQVPDVCYAVQGNMADRESGQNGTGYMADVCPTLNTVDRHAVCYPETARALTARHDSSPCIDRGMNVIAMAWANSGSAGLSAGECAPTIKATRCGEPAIMAFSASGGKASEYDGHYGNIAPTIRANAAASRPAVCVGNGQLHQTDLGDKTGALNCMHDQQAVVIPSSESPQRKFIVRRLTPTECARLQGFPDWWCEGLGRSDSAIYKAYGNGLALPCAYDVMGRIAGFVGRENE